MKRITILFSLVLALLPPGAEADYSQRSDVQQFIDEMVEKHGFDRDELMAKFAGAERLDGVLEAIANAEILLVCPSNHVVSIGPILALRGLRLADPQPHGEAPGGARGAGRYRHGLYAHRMDPR